MSATTHNENATVVGAGCIFWGPVIAPLVDFEPQISQTTFDISPPSTYFKSSVLVVNNRSTSLSSGRVSF